MRWGDVSSLVRFMPERPVIERPQIAAKIVKETKQWPLSQGILNQMKRILHVT